MNGDQPLSLAQLAANIDRAPEPLPWIVRNSDWIACALCVCIWAAWALGEWRLAHG